MIDTTRSLLAVALTLGLTACGGDTEPTEPETPAAQSQPPEQSPAAQPAPSQTGPGSSEPAETASGAGGQPGAGSGEPSGGGSAGECAFDVVVNDTISFSTSEITAPADCTEFTINLEHQGNLPVAAMGHNWVLVPEGTVQDIATAGMSVGVEGGYVPDDDRIIAASDLIGGGESTSVTFSLEGLSGDYTFVCTFPGHWSAMQGTFTVN